MVAESMTYHDMNVQIRPHVCGFECGFRSRTVPGVRSHERWCEKNPDRQTSMPPRVIQVRSKSSPLGIDRALAKVVATLYPNGIPTGDHEVLALDLGFIRDLRARLEDVR